MRQEREPTVGVGAEPGFRRSAPAATVHAIVLAGDHAWGASLFEEMVCRPLAAVAARPLICHTLRWLKAQQLCTATICANSSTPHVRHCLGDGREVGVALEYYADVMPRGPAGCVRDAGRLWPADLFVVVAAAAVPSFDIQAVIEAHQRRGAALTILACPGPHRDESGNPLLEPVGVYVFSRKVLDQIPELGYQDIKESLVPKLHAAGWPVLTHLIDAGQIWRVTNACSYLQVDRQVVAASAARAELFPGHVRQGEAHVHHSARIDPSARIIGPATLEAGCVVGPGAIIVGPTSLGAGCMIEAGAVVSRSTLWSGCRIGSGAVVDHCLVAHNAVIEAGEMVRDRLCVSSGGRRSAARPAGGIGDQPVRQSAA